MSDETLIDIIITLAAIVIVLLKVFGIITIPWIWFLAPLWIPFALGILLAIFLVTWCLIDNYKYEKKKENDYERY